MRKLYLLTIAVLGITAISNAQISKGSTFLGGSVNVYSNSSKDENPASIEDKSSSWGIRPQFGKAIATNKILGIFLNYSTSENQYASYPYSGTFPISPTKFNSENTSYGGGFFYRQYYLLSNRFFPFWRRKCWRFFWQNKASSERPSYGGNRVERFQPWSNTGHLFCRYKKASFRGIPEQLT